MLDAIDRSYSPVYQGWEKMFDRKYPGSTIVTDSVTSNGLAAFIKTLGGRHYRYRRGYKNVIGKGVSLNEEGVDCQLMMETRFFSLFCSVLFCSVLFCSVLFCSVLFCSVLFCSVLFWFIPFYSILPCCPYRRISSYSVHYSWLHGHILKIHNDVWINTSDFRFGCCFTIYNPRVFPALISFEIMFAAPCYALSHSDQKHANSFYIWIAM